MFVLLGDFLGSLGTSGSLINALTTKVPSLSAVELYNIMNINITKTTDSSKLLILDVRPRAEFMENHIKHRSCISIPAELLQQGYVTFTDLITLSQEVIL